MKTRYKIDLPRQQAECSQNYARLLKLLPDFDETDNWCIGVDNGQIQIEIVERARYTTTLNVRQQSSDVGAWSGPITLTVRLYHDANMAEVVAWDNNQQRHRPRQARYYYPNQAMYAEDEKAQCNNFLGEWLNHGLSCGRVLESFNLG